MTAEQQTDENTHIIAETDNFRKHINLCNFFFELHRLLEAHRQKQNKFRCDQCDSGFVKRAIRSAC